MTKYFITIDCFKFQELSYFLVNNTINHMIYIHMYIVTNLYLVRSIKMHTAIRTEFFDNWSRLWLDSDSV